jgi:hypothetical protein
MAAMLLMTAVGGIARAAGPGVTYSGTLTDEAGKGLSAAHFKVYHYVNQGDNVVLEKEGVTAANGAFTFGPVEKSQPFTRDRVVLFDASGHAWAWWEPLDGNRLATRDAKIVAHPPAKIGGVVVDETGKPVPGATVTLEVALYNEAQVRLDDRIGMGQVTDNAGHFVFDRIPAPGRAHVLVKKNGYALYSTARSYPDPPALPPIRAGMDDLHLILAPEAILRVQLVDGGKPVARPGVRMYARESHDPWWSTDQVKTDAQGMAIFHGLWAGRWDAIAVPVPGEDGVLTTQQVRLIKGQTADVQAECGAAGQVRGIVTDTQTHAPLSKQTVMLQLPDDPQRVALAETGTDGRFVLTAPAGKYKVTTYGWAEGGDDPISEADVEIPARGAASATKEIALTIHQQPVLRGQLVDENDKGLPGTINVNNTDIDTDAEGRFEVQQPAGRDDLILPILATDKTGKLARGIVVKKYTELQGMKVVLAPRAAVTGKIVDATGKPVADAKVAVSVNLADHGGVGGDGGWPGKLTMAKDGAFRIDGLPVGLTYVVQAERTDEWADTTVEALAPEEERDLAQLVLHRGTAGTQVANPRLPAVKPELWNGQIAGTILDENGRPLPGVELHFGNGMTTMVDDTSDIRGHFELNGVPPGKVDVWLGYGRRPGVKWTVESGKKDAVYTLKPQAESLIGKPAPGLIVQQWLTDDAPTSWDDLKGKVVLLQTGIYKQAYRPETWRRLLAKYQSQGLAILTIMQQGMSGTPPEIKAWAVDQHIDWPIAIDADEALAPAWVQRQMEGATEDMTEGSGMFLIDRNGIWRGAYTEDLLDDLLQKKD